MFTRKTRIPQATDRTVFEPVELRQMMSAAPLLSADMMQRVDSRLWQAVQDVALGRSNQMVQHKDVRFDAAGDVQGHIGISGDAAAITQALSELGVKVDGSAATTVQAWIAPERMDDVLSIPGVEQVELPIYAIPNVTTAGDTIHLADQVRARFNIPSAIDGTGLKIGVISNGVDHKASVGAELPGVTVDPAHPGSLDEGTAMLEIVHDIAPGAQLYFSGPATNVDMVASINYLKNQGCSVIVDDLSFLGEHYFSDTTVAQAADAAAQAGVTYVTSAGNFNSPQFNLTGHYQGQYAQGLSAYNGGTLHRFGAVGVDYDQITIPAGQQFRAFLEWSDPYNNSSNNYDLYLYNTNTSAILASGVSVQDGQASDHPFEFVNWTNNTGANVQAQLWVNKKSGAASRELEIFTIGNSSMSIMTQSDELIGQEAVQGVISVAAVSAASPSSIEAFSSRGGSTIYTDFTNQTKTVRQTLDGAAVDGVQTKVGQMGFFANPFYGTSASAPHAAAIAALIRDVNPSLTPAQVAQTMADTAADLGSAGYDTTYGAGRYNALDAVYKVFTPTAPDLDAGSDSGSSNTDNLTFDNTPTFVGTAPAGSFVELAIDGVVKASQQLAAGATSYQLVSTSLTDGVHNATIRVASGSSVAAANRSAYSAPLAITVDRTKPLIVDKQFVFDAPAHKITYTFNEAMFAGSLNFLEIHNNTNNTDVSVGDVLMTYDAASKTATYSFPYFATGLTDGDYTATLAGAVDAAFNIANPGSLDFFVLAGDANRDRTVNIGDFAIMAANFNNPGTFTQGDFDYSGTVGIGDFSILASQFNKSLDSARPASTQGSLQPKAAGSSLFSTKEIGSMAAEVLA